VVLSCSDEAAERSSRDPLDHPSVREMLRSSEGRVEAARGDAAFRLLPAISSRRGTGGWTAAPGWMAEVSPRGDSMWLSSPQRGRLAIKRLGMRAEDAPESRNGAVVVRGEGVDSVLFPRASDVEDLLVLDHEVPAGYDVELGKDAHLRTQADGKGAEVMNAAGDVTFRMRAERAWDARGREIAVRVETDGSRIALRIDPGARFPIAIDPAWAPVDTFPGAAAATVTLADGRLLFTGGVVIGGGGEETTKRTFLLDPLTGAQAVAAPLNEARMYHAAVTLPSGDVLVVGGRSDPKDLATSIATAELFHVAEGAWEVLPPLTVARQAPAAILLPTGKVLIAGGKTPSEVLDTAEIYDPVAKAFTAVPAVMGSKRFGASLASLPSGDVLITGGFALDAPTKSAEVFSIATSTFSPTGDMTVPRIGHSVTQLLSGKLLIAGGCPLLSAGACTVMHASMELFDPVTSKFENAAGMTTKRAFQGATLLPDGRVLLAGGGNFINGGGAVFVDTAETYDPDTNTVALAGKMALPRATFTLATTSTGRVLAWGGGSLEVYDPPGMLSASDVGSLPGIRQFGKGVALPSGRILVAGGNDAMQYLASADVFDPVSGTTTTLPLSKGRNIPAVTGLPGGKVLITGGDRGGALSVSSAELFDDATSQITTLPPLLIGRQFHTQTLLPSGNVLITSGCAGRAPDGSCTGFVPTAEIFEPATSSFRPTGAPPAETRFLPAATLLPNGKVLIVSGLSPSMEVFDPSTETFTTLPVQLPQPRLAPGVAVLPSGNVLVLGGLSLQGVPLDSTLVVDPETGASVPGPDLPDGGQFVEGIAYLPSGRIAAAFQLPPQLGERAIQVYDPVSGTFELAQMPKTQQQSVFATLPSGGIAVGSGMEGGALSKVIRVLRDDALTVASRRPPAPGAPATATAGVPFPIAGTDLVSFRAGSSGNIFGVPMGSPAGLFLPLLGGPPVLASVAPIDDAGASVTIRPTAYGGPGSLFLSRNGARSAPASVTLSAAPLGTSCSTAGQCASGQCVDGVCCNTACDSPCSACTKEKKKLGTDGTCEPVAPGADPDEDCASQPESTCGFDGACDGAGECRKHAPGVICVPPTCAGKDVFFSPYVCDGKGACQFQGTVPCVPYLCAIIDAPPAPAAPGCTAKCDVDAECVTGASCRDHACVLPSALGESCAASDTCLSGFCVDGVCCSDACDGTCVACSALKKGSGKDGLCGPIADGNDPDDECASLAEDPCGNTGTCSGSGTCKRADKGASCGPAVCKAAELGNESAQIARECDGFGTCIDGKIKKCEGYRCVTDELCGTTCKSDAECIDTAYCDTATSTCILKSGNGAECTASAECESGHCADGRCCNVTCEGSCESCNEPGSPGVCKFVDDLPRPGHADCTNQGETCGGKCSGNAPDCVYPNQAVSCGIECKGERRGIETVSFCQGNGQCVKDVARACQKYACSADGCRKDCDVDDDCEENFVCREKECVPAGGRCEEGHTVVTASGTRIDCSPFGCSEAGSCKTTCETAADCADGRRCSSAGRCVDDALAPADTSGCACGAAGSTSSLPPTALVSFAAIAFAGLARARRRREEA
jgi:hypothetical protein